MSITATKYTITSFNRAFLRYYGQKPTSQSSPEKPRIPKPQLISQEPKTRLEKFKQYVWTVPPFKTLIKPVGSIVTFALEEVRALVQLIKYLPKHIAICREATFSKNPPDIETLQIIDSREPIKERLTGQENNLGVFAGQKYLYFKQNGPEEKFLILMTENDYNGALQSSYLIPLIKQLSKRFDVKFRTISSVEDIQREIQNATQFGRVTGLMLGAHGSPSRMNLHDPYFGTGDLTAVNISPDLFSGLDPSCVIVLNSCSTARYPYFSIAYRVANVSKRVTFAADDDSYGIKLEQLNPLKFSFEKPGKPVKTKKIQPLEDDSFLTFLKSFKGTYLKFFMDTYVCAGKGTYVCAGCEEPLFSSKAIFKYGTFWSNFIEPINDSHFNHGTFWSNFIEPINVSHIILQEINIFTNQPPNVCCSNCGLFLGLLLYDGPKPAKTRYWIDPEALKLKKKKS